MISNKKIYEVIEKRIKELDWLKQQAEREKDNYHVLQYENKMIELNRLINFIDTNNTNYYTFKLNDTK